MNKLKVGDKVEVLDPGLLMLYKFAPPGAPKNNIGYIREFYFDDGEALIEFPIGDDDMDEHSQVAPYPLDILRKVVEG